MVSPLEFAFAVVWLTVVKVIITAVILSIVSVWVCGMKQVHVPVNEVVRETSLCCCELHMLKRNQSVSVIRGKKAFVDVRKGKNYSLLW